MTSIKIIIKLQSFILRMRLSVETVQCAMLTTCFMECDSISGAKGERTQYVLYMLRIF